MSTHGGLGRPAISLSARLVAGALVWLTLILVLGGGVLSSAFRDTVEQEFSHRLDAMLRAMIASTEIGPEGTISVVHPLGDPRFEQIFSGWYWQVTEPSGRQFRSRSLWDSVIAPSAGGTELQTRRIDGPNGEALLVVERDLQFSGQDGWVHLLIAADMREVKEGARRFDLLLLSALGLLGVGMVIAILIQVRFGLQPLRAMAADLNAVREGDRSRLSGRYPKEVLPLAEAMNGVLDKDAELIERARTHVGNLAHGLKTPLAVVAAEMGADRDRAVVGQQLNSMRRLIEHHLGRASAVAGAGRVLGVKVLVNDVTEGLTRALSRIFSERNLSFETRIPGKAAFHGHREDLEEILGNLMENACKWAASRIQVSAIETDGQLVLSVEDDGPGMPLEFAAEASVRGKRLDEMSPGWGLGLSIVSDLVEVNGGDMTLGSSDLGGLLVSIRIPCK